MAEIQIFLSSVSAEFRSYREILRRYLARPNVTVKVQEDFIVTGSETLDMLDQYIRACDVVIHLVGDMTGALAQSPSIACIRQRYPDFSSRLPAISPALEADGPTFSYTQWEAWLALYHGKRLIIAVPEADVRRDAAYVLEPRQQAAQQAHLARLAATERYPGIRFTSADQFAAEIWRSALLDILVAAGLVHKAVKLPYRSLGDLFKGRDPLLAKLGSLLGPLAENNDSPARAVVLTGMGGVGKTRLALEYAWHRAGTYQAVLLVDADSLAALNRNLAALCAASVLDLPARQEADESRQREAVIGWLHQHPGSLLILDNVDSEPAATAVEALLPQLGSCHLIVTSRLLNWSRSVTPLPVDVLHPDDAADILLQRTADKRRRQGNDPALAHDLARELGCLALALEQAGAYINHRRLTLGQYLDIWQSQRDQALAWFDPRTMQYPKSVAVTWQTSFDQLGDASRRLLQRLAWLSPEPIPESLLDTPVAGEDPDATTPWDALVELESFSLVSRAADLPEFSVHRLIQEVTRQGMHGDSAQTTLNEALAWLNDAFVGSALDVRSWPVLDPLAPHAQAVARHAEQAGIADPTNRLLSATGELLFQKASYSDAEPLMRRALAIDEASFGANHPKVATDLNNLASLLQATNRLAEAEPLMRRALSIDETSFGADHPHVTRDLNNLASLLQETNRLAEAEPLIFRALSIDEASFGADHPMVAIRLNNLASLLQATNRLAEAEPLMRRALSIDEASFGADHPDVARDLNNLASLLQDTNRQAEAEPLLRRALSIGETSFGTDHPKVAILINNLASLLQDTNRLAEAEPLMRRALSIDETSFGADHPKVAIRLNNLASLLQDTNRLPEAEPLMRRALAILIASLGSTHPNSQIVSSNFVELLEQLGRSETEITAAVRACKP